MRSDFVRHLVQSEDTLYSHTQKLTNNIPRIIVQFWDDEVIPNDVQECIETWRQLKSRGIEHFLFNEGTARKFIAEKLSADNVKAFDRCYHPAMKSDYFRLCFISCTGGFYVDVDDFYCGIDVENLFTDQMMKLQPLCFDINTNGMVDPRKFIINGGFSESWIFYFNNNPIIAPPNSPIIEYALARSTRLILVCDEYNLPEIQSTTGPGNLSASVVAYLSDYQPHIHEKCLSVLADWQIYAKTIWELSYRNDERNWRLSNRKTYMPVKLIQRKA
jgi:hypothetical protein